MKIYRQRLFSMIDPSIVSRFLGVLGGFIFKAKVLHWAAKGKDIHEYLDNFWKLLYEFQDTIAEGWMGIGGKFSASEIGFVVSESDEPREFLREVEEKVLDFYELLPDEPRFKGLSGEVEGFIQEIQKYKYLFGLCYENSSEEREFSDDEKKKRNILGGTVVLGGSAAAGYGGHKLLKKGRGLSDKLKNITSDINLEKAGIEGSQSELNSLWEAAKHATDKEAHEQLEGKMTAAKEKIAKGKSNIESLEKLKNGLPQKAKKLSRGGKALVATSIAAPVVYFGGKAIKNRKNNSKKENK